jgi:hypothetical protein
MTVMKIPSPNSPSRMSFLRVWMWDLRRTGKGSIILLVLRSAGALVKGGKTNTVMSKTIVIEAMDV